MRGWIGRAPRAALVPAYVGLGGNVGGEAALAARFASAARAMAALAGVRSVRLSSLYASAPVGPVREQPTFVNAVAALLVEPWLAPHAILHALLAIEAAHGRDRARETAQGPRTLDLDLLLVGDAVLESPGLTLPHPRLGERVFALAPLAEVAGEALKISGPRGGQVGDLLSRARRDPTQAVQRL
jgi:2-amino-4-hydroxy-6-hydroxymethyldihydropteridine diphosphokinase